jgi:hypothetical protein
MLTPIKAIRAKCLDCCCGSAREVELCPILDCSLYPYRFGKNPNIKLSDEQRARRAAHFKNKARQQDAQSSGVTGEGNYTPDTEKATESHAGA